VGPSLWQKIGFLLLGLILPGLVLLSLYASDVATAGLAEPLRTITIFAVTTVGLAGGSVILWWLVLKIYRRKHASP